MADEVQGPKNPYEGSGPFSMAGLLQTGLGLATGGIGGWLGSLGLKFFTDSSSNTMKNANQGFLQDAEKFQLANMYNAAGRTGSAVQQSFDKQFNKLQNSAEAVNSYNAQNQTAGKLLSSAQSSMNSVSQNAQRAMGSQTSGMLDILKQQGASPAAMMAAANRIGDNTSQALGSQAQMQNQAAQSAAGQAGQLYGAAPQTLNQDIATRYNVQVKPFEAQSSGLGSQMVQSIPGSMQSTASQQSMANPMAGLAQGLGYYGAQNIRSPWGNGAMEDMFRALFQNHKTEDKK